jgi:hypothetical protein
MTKRPKSKCAEKLLEEFNSNIETLSVYRHREVKSLIEASALIADAKAQEIMAEQFTEGKEELADFWPNPKLGEVARHVAKLLKAERQKVSEEIKIILMGVVNQNNELNEDYQYAYKDLIDAIKNLS